MTLLLQALIKAERGFAMYLPNNPLHEKFFEDFLRRLEAHLDEFGALRLDLAHDRIFCRGETVYTSEDRRENFAFRMFSDGIRMLVVDEGVDAREVRALVEAIGQPAADGGEDDVVTRLWSADLRHIIYLVAELPLDTGAPPLDAGTASTSVPGARIAQEGMIRRFAAGLAAAPLSPEAPATPVSPQIYTLDELDLDVLQALVAAEQRRTPLEDMAAILEAVIVAETDADELEEFLGIVAHLSGDLLQTGHIDEAVKLIRMLARIGARADLPPGHAAAIAGARGRVMTPEALAGLTRQLGGDTVDREDLRTLVTTLGVAAIEPFCRVLGEVNAKETRRVLIEALAETGRGSPELFLPFLSDPRWYLVRNTVYILRRIGSPEAAHAVRRCAGHKDARVRKEVLLYLEETGDPAAEQLLLTFLADEVPSLRIAATRGLARRGSSTAAGRLLALAAAEGFVDRERPEREAVWEAIGEIAPERALPLLREMLLKRHWFGPARELEETASAVAGLRRIGSPEALELLRQAAATKRGRPRELVEKALRAQAPTPGAGVRTRDSRKDGEGDRG